MSIHHNISIYILISFQNSITISIKIYCVYHVIFTISYHIISYHIMSHCIIISYHIVSYYIILHYLVMYYITLYCMTLHYIILYESILTIFPTLKQISYSVSIHFCIHKNHDSRHEMSAVSPAEKNPTLQLEFPLVPEVQRWYPS